ncbi:MAG TPA: amino acid transporter, partial [Marisediminicola sp.]|nr:amino acid transporter [Marisediminicola sp.]
PDGIAISGLFIAAIVAVSLISRVYRATELRVETINFDVGARRIIAEVLEKDGELNIIANRRRTGDLAEYAEKEASQRAMNPVPATATVVFLEVTVSDPSSFGQTLDVRGHTNQGYNILRVDSPAVPNAIAAILLALRDVTGVRPQCHFEWAEGNPIVYMFRFLLFGRGDTAPLVREILREAEKDPAARPSIHVGG